MSYNKNISLSPARLRLAKSGRPHSNDRPTLARRPHRSPSQAAPQAHRRSAAPIGAAATRFDAQLAEVLSYHPRDSADAMLATQCVLLRLLAEDCHRDANRPDPDPAKVKKLLRTAKQFDQLLAGMMQTLTRRQEQPIARMDPATFVSLGLEQFLIPDPEDPNEVEEAFSAIIVPLHPAPKLLQ